MGLGNPFTYGSGVLCCFIGLALYGREINSDASIMPGVIITVIGVTLLLISYTK